MRTALFCWIAQRLLTCRGDAVILVLNCGSSSLKYSLFDEGERVRAGGHIERIGETDSSMERWSGGRREQHSVVAADHSQAMAAMGAALEERGQGAYLLKAIGHRVVHGGERFVESALITQEVEEGIDACAELAPLHNPAALAGISAARQLFAGVPQVAVFDTAFHQTMPERAFLYAIPRSLYREQGIRRYGFHGTSHRYVAQRAAEVLRMDPEEFTGITCHLGNGCSLAAIENGRSIDTTMGLTPLEGVAMGTRSGDVDPALIFHLARSGMELADIERLLVEESGLLGLSGHSQDVRQLEAVALEGDEAAQVALDVFAYRVRKAIGSLYAVIGHMDALVFTGGIGENSAFMRRRIIDGLEGFGLQLDPARNRAHSRSEGEVSSFGARVKILVIPTNEELVIAREARDLISRKNEG
ncbi:MAG: acetate kinase [Candidatus Latescibacterota bacterium]|jgi:acetate kinase